MRRQHEKEHGIICEKCKCHASKTEYTRINAIQPLPNDTTGRMKTTDRLNLCNACYEEYQNLIRKFIKGVV